jgi:ribonuclease BN (tRNA processing enzyme)
MAGDAEANDPAGSVITLLPVGTAAAFGGVGEAQSAYLVTGGGRRVLVDAGSGALSALAVHMAPEALDAVLVSHLHPDHCSDLLALHVHMRWGPGRGRVIPVIGPPGLRERLTAFAGSAEPWTEAQGLRFDVLAAGSGRRDLGGGLLLRHAEVPHLPPTHAMRFECGETSLCYGADCAPGDALVALARGCDLLILECAFGDRPVPDGVPHLNATTAGELARAAGARRLLLTHCQSRDDRDAALARARAVFGGPVDWARPGVEVRL